MILFIKITKKELFGRKVPRKMRKMWKEEEEKERRWWKREREREEMWEGEKREDERGLHRKVQHVMRKNNKRTKHYLIYTIE